MPLLFGGINCDRWASGNCTAGRRGSSIPKVPSVWLRHILLVGPLALWPGALDIGEDSPDLRIAQDIGKAGHVALVATAHDGGRAFLDDAEQDVIGLVPRVAAGIVRWRRETPGRKGRLPVRLPLELRTVAGRTLVRIDLFGVSAFGTDLGLRIMEGLGLVAVT